MKSFGVLDAKALGSKFEQLETHAQTLTMLFKHATFCAAKERPGVPQPKFRMLGRSSLPYQVPHVRLSVLILRLNSCPVSFSRAHGGAGRRWARAGRTAAAARAVAS